MLLHHHSSRAGFILQNIEHISQEQCNDGSRDLSIQWKVEEGQQCIAFCMKAQEIMVSLPLLLCLCRYTIYYRLFSHCSSRLPALAGQNLSPLFPRIWRQIRKKLIIIMATLLRSLTQLSFIQTLWEGWSRGTLTSCRSLPRRLHQGYWNNELEQWNWGELHHQTKHWLTEYKQEACYSRTS